MDNNAIAFVLLRLAVAASMFGHGLVRLPKLNGFSGWMVKSFENSMLPKIMVVPFSYALPIAEFVIGALLILGLFTRASLIGGSIVMFMLIMGTTLIEHWEALPSQLIHVAFFAVLLVFIRYNTIAVDHLIKK
ncbi:DoxX family protein [Chitinophaga nivalis]|uniref:DoxX family membrane protein n=1 Tax=Chitinophaga nivalis TaxID=2991709 RepID=A0ABT3IX37_9BACT|nr:DoxX family membrane protein [Chitinophaga nivalis]MCW3462019.1 DoxX family membrane protein [Chitinophaga nivalis]MCW3488289.1 DoxX family membrane protein [Chitinophaga nivalis]